MGAILNNRFVKWVLAPVVVLCALAVAIWAYFQHEYPTCTFRYKLTAEVQTPNGVKTGSSVVEVSYSSVSPIPNPGRWRNDKLSGEAVYINLGQGKNLFVLLTSNESNRIRTDRDVYGCGRGISYDGALRAIILPLAAYKLSAVPGTERLMQQQITSLANSEPREIALENIPTVVSFADMRDKNSVFVIEPDDLTQKLGQGYSISKISVEITNEPVTHQIEKVLPWLEDERPKNGQRFVHNLDLLFYRLSIVSFIQPI